MRRPLFRLIAILFLVMALPAAAVPVARAALAHRYSFSGNANDSVGTAHGTVVDAGTPTAIFAAGQLDLSANNGEGSNGITGDAYVNLPNDLISGAATAGVNGAVSLEWWVTVSTTRTWQRLGDFGTSDGGEDTSPGGGGSPYLYVAANSGRFTNGLATEVHAAGDPLAETGQTGPTPNGVQLHVVSTYDHNDTSSGANGTMRLYRDGAQIGAAAMPPTFDLNTFTNNNNWLGRSQWNDPIFDGLYNEFRIYDHALSSSEVGTSFIFGPDAVSTGEIFSLEVNTTNGNIRLINETAIDLDFDFYRISSAGNALSLAGWNSLDDQNISAVDGDDPGSVAGDSPGEGWDQSGGSNAGQLVELFLGANGSRLAANQSHNLGSAFNTAIGGNDLQFTFGLVGGIQISGPVTYVTGGGADADFDNNNIVNGADLTVWRNSFGASANADADGDGDSDANDFLVWQRRLGTPGSAPTATATPEPLALTMAAWCAGCAIALFRRRA